MKFVGRTPSSTAQPRACMCNNDGTFLTGRSDHDTCANCGCICGIILRYYPELHPLLQFK